MNYQQYAETNEITGQLLQDYERAVCKAAKTGTAVYELTGDRYFPDRGFLTHDEVEDEIAWWDNEDGEDNYGIWDCVKGVEATHAN